MLLLMLQEEHCAILLTFIKLPFSIKTFVLYIFEWPLKTGFTVSHTQAQVENGTIIKQTLDDEVDNTSDNKMDNTTLWITLSGHDTYYIPAEFNLTSSLSNQTDEDEYWQEVRINSDDNTCMYHKQHYNNYNNSRNSRNSNNK